MEFSTKKLERAGKFTAKLSVNALIRCPKCRQTWGVKKWDRLATNSKMICPGCRAEHEKGTTYSVSFTEKEFRPPTTPNIPVPEPAQKVSLGATVKAHDTLIRKDEQK